MDETAPGIERLRVGGEHVADKLLCLSAAAVAREQSGERHRGRLRVRDSRYGTAVCGLGFVRLRAFVCLRP